MDEDHYGEAWVYESLVGAIPGFSLPDRLAVAVQFVLFETVLLALAWVYDLDAAVLPGTVAVGVAAAGSAFMLDIASRARRLDMPDTYRRLLFSSNMEVVLGIVAYAALVTYLFVYDPRTGTGTLIESLLGSRPPVLAVFLMLLVAWDVCYRIGTGWWTAIVTLYATLRYDLPATAALDVHAVAARTAGFALVQFALVPFVLAHPVLAVAVAGHVVAVGIVLVVAVILVRTSSTSSA